MTETEVGLISSEKSRVYEAKLKDTSLPSIPAGVFTRRESTYLLLEDGNIFQVIAKDAALHMIPRAECGVTVGAFETAIYTEDDFLLLTSKNRQLRILNTTDGRCEEVTNPPRWFKELERSRVRDVTLLSDLVTLAVATENGLFVIDTSNNTSDWIRKIDSKIRSDDFTSVVEVSDGIVWVGSFLGLVELRDSDILEVSQFGGINSPEVIAIDGTPKLGTFVATPNKVFHVRSTNDSVKVVPNLSLSEELTISSMHVLPDGIWIGGTSGNLYFFKHSSQIDRSPLCTIESSITSPTPVSSISRLVEEKEVLIASWFGGSLHTVKNCEVKKIELTPKYVQLLEGQLKLLRSGAQGVIYSVGFNGVFVIHGSLSDPRNIVSILRSEQLSEMLAWDGIRSGSFDFFTSKTGDIFYISPGSVIAKKSIETHLVASLPSEVFSVELDELRRMWVVTQEGIWLIGEAGPSLEYQSRSEAPISLDYGVSFASSDGNLYFGGTGGFLIVNRPEMHPIMDSNSVRVLDLRVDGSNVSRFLSRPLDSDRLEIKSSLEITVGTSYSLKPGNGSIQHTLQGYDTDWINTGSRGSAVYSNLPPGDYTFRARGANASGDWSDNEISLPIRVLTPFWRTYWAFALYFVLIAIALLIAKRLNDARVLRADRLLRAQEQAVAFARLEDDFQNQHEATQSVIRRERNSAADLLKAIRFSVAPELKEDNKTRPSAPLAEILDALETIQHDATRSSWQQQISLMHVTNLLIDLVLTSKLSEIDVVVVNKSDEHPIPLSEASLIAAILAEVLVVLRSSLLASKLKLAACSVEVVGPFESEDRAGNASYKLAVASDIDWLANEENATPTGIAAHLVSRLGDSIDKSSLRSNELKITVDLG
ncbi:MAG: triple tyrosine motif-containing protein [Verrucomicrobiota bacterium]